MRECSGHPGHFACGRHPVRPGARMEGLTHWPSEPLKEGGSASASRRGKRTHGVLVSAEFAMAVILLTGAGLLIRSFLAVLAIAPGFRPEHVLMVNIDFPDSTPQSTQIA